jgi:RNA polymerase sigma-70 factor (ECF subfamily)
MNAILSRVMQNTVMEPSCRFDRVLLEHGDALGRLAAVYAVDPWSREDLLQEILLAIWRALPAFREECSERTFIFRIGHNRGITHRARGRSHLGIEAAERVADPRPTPEGEFHERAEREGLLAGVRSLPPALRQTVMLFLEGLSNDEIAQVLGISENNVAVRLHRGRAALRALLGAEASER